MNDTVRALTRKRLEAAGMTPADAARALGVGESVMYRILNDTGGKGGKLPPTWVKLLDLLELEVTVKAKPGDPEKLRAKALAKAEEQRLAVLSAPPKLPRGWKQTE